MKVWQTVKGWLEGFRLSKDTELVRLTAENQALRAAVTLLHQDLAGKVRAHHQLMAAVLIEHGPMDVSEDALAIADGCSCDVSGNEETGGVLVELDDASYAKFEASGYISASERDNMVNLDGASEGAES